MTSLFHTYVLNITQQICELDLFRINLKFEIFCNSGYLHFSKYIRETTLTSKTDIWDSNLVLKIHFLLCSRSRKSIPDSATSNMGSDISYSRGTTKAI